MTTERVLWRIAADTPDFEANDLSGAGARATGGRWNRAGTPMLYCAESRALACLETTVHLARHALPLNRYLVRIEPPAEAFADAIGLDPADLVGWDAEPAGRASIDWGTRWVQGHASLLASVPSVIVPEERNYLINPLHPQIARVGARKVRRWGYDSRLEMGRGT